MYCPSCKSDRIYGPHYACDIVTRLQQAFMVCGNCWATFDAYDNGWVVVLQTNGAATAA
jgi:hypothetical protein